MCVKPLSKLAQLSVALGTLIFGINGFPVPERPLPHTHQIDARPSGEKRELEREARKTSSLELST